jgi:hypothetical protein
MHSRRRAELRAALTARFAWVTDPDVGPHAVQAGECDTCGAEPRLVTTCGPGSAIALGRQCARRAGESAWCDGHREAAQAALTALAALPGEADTVARMWWVATGEVALPAEQVGTALALLSLPAGGTADEVVT